MTADVGLCPVVSETYDTQIPPQISFYKIHLSYTELSATHT